MNRTAAAVLITILVVLPFGFFVGFISGVYSTELGQEFIDGAFAEEEIADTENFQTIETDRLVVSYPGNWILADDEDSFDINGYFSIDSPGFSYVLFEVYFVECSEQDSMNETLEHYEQMLNVETREAFNTWGEYEGTGTILEGVVLGSPVRVKVFAHSSEGLCLTVTEYWDVETEDLVAPGFKVISDSLEFFEPESNEASKEVETETNDQLDVAVP